MAHGQYVDWLRSVDFDRKTAARFVQSYEQFADVATSRHLPVGKIFEMLSLPSDIDRSDFVSNLHTIPSTGAEKTVDVRQRKNAPSRYYRARRKYYA